MNVDDLTNEEKKGIVISQSNEQDKPKDGGLAYIESSEWTIRAFINNLKQQVKDFIDMLKMEEGKNLFGILKSKCNEIITENKRSILRHSQLMLSFPAPLSTTQELKPLGTLSIAPDLSQD